MKEKTIANVLRIVKTSRRSLVTLILIGVICSLASYNFLNKDGHFQAALEFTPSRTTLDLTASNASKASSGENYSMKGRASWNGNLRCPFEGKEGDPSFRRLKDFFREETAWKNGIFNIFLIETSCNSRPAYRVWCSVESMAQQNPDAIVWYVMTSPEVDIRGGLVESLLQKYPNLRLVTVDLGQVFNGTPLEELYRSGAWHTDTKWPAANLSNMIRMAIVWHAGGFYSDTDVICISPLTGLRNVIGLASFNLANGADFHFDRHHPMLEHFMSYLNEHFNPYVWGMNGPQTVSAVLRNVCQESILHQDLECEGVRILPFTSFNPIQPHVRRLLFQRSTETDMNKRFPNSYTIHFWNRVTHDNPVIKESGTIYDLASASFCPMSREAATKNSPVF